MRVCDLLSGCAFFNDKMQGMPSTAEMIKERLCRGDHSTCARHMVCEKLGRPRVPADLFPNDVPRAHRILGTAPSNFDTDEDPD
jgi:hypothetical protein